MIPPNDPSQPAPAIPILSLFSGAGGLDLGFKQSGFTTELAVDSSRAAIQTLVRNSSARLTANLDLGAASCEVLIDSLAELRPRGVIGGPPCQGFSNGNVAQKARDPRNRLPFDYARLLTAIQSKYELDFFVFENVTGLLRQRHAARLARLKRHFRSAGFVVSLHEVDALAFGVPQSRRRLFIIGLRKSHASKFILETPSATQVRTVRNTISHLPEPTYFRRGMTPADIPYHQNHWTMAPKSDRFETREFNRWRSFRKLEWDEPSPTVAYGNREIHVHPNGNRRLSILEAMLLQGFPESYTLCGNLSEQVTQVSNAVPPPVARAIALQLRRFASDPSHSLEVSA